MHKYLEYNEFIYLSKLCEYSYTTKIPYSVRVQRSD